MGWVVDATPRHGRFAPGKWKRHPLCRRRSGQQGRYRLVQKISPLLGFDPRTVHVYGLLSTICHIVFTQPLTDF